MSLFTLLLLYVTFRIKQVVCDFILQTGWMALNKGLPGWAGYKPLLVHSGIHATGTLCIMLLFSPHLWWLSIIDFLVHSMVDRLKALLTIQQQWTPENWKYWWSFGLDQEAHNFTHLIYILIVISAAGGVVLQ